MPIAYQLTRSARRKSIAIKVTHNGIDVRAPYSVPQTYIDNFVDSKQQWIQLKQIQLSTIQQQRPNFLGIDGEIIYVRGKTVELQIRFGLKHHVEQQQEKLIITLNNSTPEDKAAATSKKLIFQWYQQQAKQYLSERAFHYAHKLGKEICDIKIRRTKSKWGHCTNTGVLQFNWLIMQAADDIIDYLVIHEVSHLVHHNHSALFWQQVQELCPDWKSKRLWLRENGHRLDL